MLIRLTETLRTRAGVAPLEPVPPHENLFLDWSAHLFRAGRSPFILLCNTRTLLTAVLPGRGITGENSLRERLLGGIHHCLETHGGESVRRHLAVPAAPSIRFAKTLNRSVTGSMNELTRTAEVWLAEGGISLPELSDKLNTTLLSALAPTGAAGYGTPREAFAALLNEARPVPPET
jgi:hypothetical protein